MYSRHVLTINRNTINYNFTDKHFESNKQSNSINISIILIHRSVRRLTLQSINIIPQEAHQLVITSHIAPLQYGALLLKSDITAQILKALTQIKNQTNTQIKNQTNSTTSQRCPPRITNPSTKNPSPFILMHRLMFIVLPPEPITHHRV